MSDFTNFRDRNRDQQDSTERGVWGEMFHVEGSGSYMSVRGTGTIDEELPVMNFGYGFNLDGDSDSEVIMVSLGSDTNDKVAIPTIPRNKQHPWQPGAGGIQNPNDASRRIEIGPDETWLKDGNYVYGNGREQTVSFSGGNITVALVGGQTITINGDNTITISGGMTMNVSGNLNIAAQNIALQSSTLTHNGKNIGNTHKHGGVMSGGGNTLEPI